jgi:hypothetical protein
MFTSFPRSRRWSWNTAAALAVALVLAAVSTAQPPRAGDYLDQVRKREEIARQKVEADVRAALQTVQSLTTADPAKAVVRLRDLLAFLENDSVLTKERRERLQRMVQDRIRVTETEKDNVAAADASRDDQQARANARRALEEQQAAERERLRREIDALRAQQNLGQTQDASRTAADVARRNPTNPAAQAGSRISTANEQISAARRFEFDRQRGLAGVQRDLERSATPPAGDMDFPRDWAERTKGRNTAQPLTPKEKAILAALSSPVLVNFKNSRFDDVMEYLQTLIGQPIIVEPGALKEAEITYETPITLNAKGITARTALRKILAELGLSYVIKDETIQVTTLQRARDTMVVRSYPVADLVLLQRPEFGQFGGRFVTPFEVQKNVEELMRMLQNSVDAGSWQLNGGTGTIAYHAPSNSLIIKQTAEVHMLLGRK